MLADVCRGFRQSLKDNLKGKKGKCVPLHAMEALVERGGIAPTYS
jgi:hypothetical protein